MADVRAMLRKVQRLEQAALAPKSPFEVLYGGVDGFAANVEGLDATDFAQVTAALHRWEREGVWDGWHRLANRWVMQ